MLYAGWHPVHIQLMILHHSGLPSLGERYSQWIAINQQLRTCHTCPQANLVEAIPQMRFLSPSDSRFVSSPLELAMTWSKADFPASPVV